jgi:hypothetical protein
MLKNYLVITDEKGGVGKSQTALLASSMLSTWYRGMDKVKLVDTDFSNSVLASVFGMEKIQMVDSSNPMAKAQLTSCIYRQDGFTSAVVDCGARDERTFRPIWKETVLPALKAQAKSGQLIFLRPLTMSVFVQNNLISFCEEFVPLGAKIVILQMRFGGRTKDHFERYWEQKVARQRLLAMKGPDGRPAVIETFVSDMGCPWADEMIACGLSPIEIADGDFSRIVDADLLTYAKEVLTEDVQLLFKLWLGENIDRLEKALSILGVAP